MNSTLIISITQDDEVSVNLPVSQEYLTSVQSALYLLAYKLDDERVSKLAEELIDEYDNQIEGIGGMIH